MGPVDKNQTPTPAHDTLGGWVAAARKVQRRPAGSSQGQEGQVHSARSVVWGLCMAGANEGKERARQ